MKMNIPTMLLLLNMRPMLVGYYLQQNLVVSTFTHKSKFTGDSKRAMDEYTSQIMMGGHNTLVIHNTCEDSLLASPLILDLVILAELCTRVHVCFPLLPFRVFYSFAHFDKFRLKTMMNQPLNTNHSDQYYRF